MFESLTMYSLALGAEEQRTHCQDFQTCGPENYSKDSSHRQGHQFFGTEKEGARKEVRPRLLL